MDLTLSARDVQGTTVLAVAGEIDVETAPQLRQAITELTTAGATDVVLDLTGVGFMDSTGLSVLVGALRRIRAHDGAMRIVSTQESTLRLFEVTGLSKVFFVDDTVEGAVRAVAATGSRAGQPLDPV